jgi:hypothetical protein
VGLQARLEVPPGAHGALEPGHKITPTPLQIQQLASAMMLLVRDYRTTNHVMLLLIDAVAV